MLPGCGGRGGGRFFRRGISMNVRKTRRAIHPSLESIRLYRTRFNKHLLGVCDSIIVNEVETAIEKFPRSKTLFYLLSKFVELCTNSIALANSALKSREHARFRGVYAEFSRFSSCLSFLNNRPTVYYWYCALLRAFHLHLERWSPGSSNSTAVFHSPRVLLPFRKAKESLVSEFLTDF